VWRLARDRVLLRRVGDHSGSAAIDLLGAAAVVWVAAEEPLTPDELVTESELSTDAVAESIELLVTGHWLVPAP
jgi:hypothetical protein